MVSLHTMDGGIYEEAPLTLPEYFFGKAVRIKIEMNYKR